MALIYKERWHIEISFKALKQNLKIKSFVGASPNTLEIQIWTATFAKQATCFGKRVKVHPKLALYY
jgi:IS4 transposase